LSAPACVGIDVGGTKFVAGLLDAAGGVLDRRRVATPRGDADALLDRLSELARALGPGLPVGVGIAGIVDRSGSVRYGPNLGITDLPVASLLAERLGVRVAVGNDASVALHGEQRAGAGAGVDDVVMLTLGTGVGGGLMLGGRLVEGAHGLGGELGHVIVHDGGRLCPCGNAGCLEAYASGTAIAARAHDRLATGAVESVLLERPLDEVDGKLVTAAALGGDAFAVEVLAEAGHWLGVGIASLVNAFDPELVLVGGGAGIHAAELVLPAARRVVAERVMGAAHRPPVRIELAALGDDAGMVGAGLLALEGRP
jgi:glucokinase